MAEDWYADVNKHAPGADAIVVRKIVNHCGIALRNRDSQLVSFGDATEIGRVRERFLRKKLALTDGDDMLDRGIAAVRDHMTADRTKNRVTVYYLLADWFGKHDLFGGSASAPGNFSFAAPAAVAVAVAAPPKPKPARKAPAPASAAKVASAPVEAAKTARAPRKTAAASAAAAPVVPTAVPTPTPVASTPAHQSLYTPPEGSAARPMYIGYKDEGGGMVWPHWSAIVALLIAVVVAVVLVRPA